MIRALSEASVTSVGAKWHEHSSEAHRFAAALTLVLADVGALACHREEVCEDRAYRPRVTRGCDIAGAI